MPAALCRKCEVRPRAGGRNAIYCLACRGLAAEERAERRRVRAREWGRAHKEENRARAKRWRLANPERADESRRRAQLKRCYGLRPEQHEVMLAAQDGKCAVCGATEDTPETGWKLSVDHCHETGRNRGLLCGHCNRALGLMADDPARLRAAADYLEAS